MLRRVSASSRRVPSQSDVLHIGMIFWAYRIYKLMDDIKDSLHIRNALSDILSMSKDDALTDFGTFPKA